jgi:hypothetical protein
MNVEILSHDVATGDAIVKFTYKDVVHTGKYNLMLVIPGSKMLMEQWGQEFTKEMQLKALDRLTEWITRDIDAGTFQTHLDGLHPDDPASRPPLPDPVPPPSTPPI